jgi:hypothetical protein
MKKKREIGKLGNSVETKYIIPPRVTTQNVSTQDSTNIKFELPKDGRLVNAKSRVGDGSERTGQAKGQAVVSIILNNQAKIAEIRSAPQ